jgi:iron complex outermembrane recepter protein
VTKQPLAKTGAIFGLSSDEDGLIRGTADLNLGLDRAGVRINVAVENGKSFRDDVDNRTLFAAIATRLDLGERTTLRVEGEVVDRNGVFDRGFVSNALFRALPAERFLGDPADDYANRTVAGTATINHEFSDNWNARLTGAWARGVSVGDYFFPIGVGAVPLVSATGILNRRFQFTDDRQTDRSASLEVTGKFSTGAIGHTLLAALDWNDEKATSIITRATVNAPINIFAPTSSPRSPVTAPIINTVAKNRSFGGLLQLETKWSDWLHTTAGVRVERVKSRFTNRLALANQTQRAAETATTPRLGITILPVATVSLFGNWGRSFAPEVGTRPILGNLEPEPSRGEQFEVGVKWEAADGKVRAQAALFQITKTNVRVAEPSPSPFDRQVGEQRSKGVELSLAAQPVPQLRLEAAYAYTDAKVRIDPILAGRTLQSTPEHSASLWARYDFTRAFGAGFGAFLVSDRFVDTANSFQLDGYARVDAALYWQPAKAVKVQLNLLNAFGTRYFENGNTNNNFYPGQPRTIRGSVQFSF